MGAFSTLLDALIPNRYIRRFWALQFSIILNSSLFRRFWALQFRILLNSSQIRRFWAQQRPKYKRILGANSTLLGATASKVQKDFRRKFDAFGRNSIQSTIEQFDAFWRKLSSKRRINSGTFRRMASKSVEYIVCWVSLVYP